MRARDGRGRRLRHRFPWAALTAAEAIILFATAALSHAQAQPSIDLPVCVTANDAPASDSRHAGYEQKVATIIGQELHATVRFVWTPSGQYAVRHQLATGACDLVMGAPEGATGVLNSVPYFRAPFVFLYRSGSGYAIHGLNDPALKKLTIAVQSRGLAYTVLADAGLTSSITPINADYSVFGAPTILPLVRAVEHGRVDAALVYGPYASVYVRQRTRGLRMSPVSPAITSAGYAMFRIETLGVRPGDGSLQRDLGHALAAGWPRIEAALKATGLPTLPVSKPVASPPPPSKPLVIGVVLPIPTAYPAATDEGARAARAGASLAERIVGRNLRHRDLRVRFASSPNAAAAERAARRLVLVDHVSAVVGGMGSGQAAALGRVARELHVPFFNIADATPSLRTPCNPYVFHVAASESMYMDALARWSIARKRGRWFVVAQGPQAQAAVREAQRALKKAGGGDLAGSADLPAGTSSYYRVFGRVAEASPDLVVLDMDPLHQGLFISQLPSKDAGWSVAGTLPTYAQDRYAFSQLTQDNASPIADYRPVMWDAAQTAPAAKRLDQAFGGQFGTAIDAGAWSTYMAVKIVADASKATGSIDPGVLAGYVADPSHGFRLDKGVPLSFRSWNHQLRQPLYISKLDPAAPWGADPGAQAALASVVATVPTGLGSVPGARKLLDSLGQAERTATCPRP